MPAKIHAAKLHEGGLLWPAFKLLKERGEQGATTLEIDKALNPDDQPRRILNPTNAITDIRKRAPELGWTIPHGKAEGQRGGRRVYRYHAQRIQGWQPPTVEEKPSSIERPASPHAEVQHGATPSGLLFDLRPSRTH